MDNAWLELRELQRGLSPPTLPKYCVGCCVQVHVHSRYKIVLTPRLVFQHGAPPPQSFTFSQRGWIQLCGGLIAKTMTMYSSISIHESKKSIHMLTQFCLVADFLAELMWMCERIERLFFLLYCCGESCRALHREFLRFQHSLIPHPTFFFRLPLQPPPPPPFLKFLSVISHLSISLDVPPSSLTPPSLSSSIFSPHLSLKCEYILIIFQANGLSAQKGN